MRIEKDILLQHLSYFAAFALTIAMIIKEVQTETIPNIEINRVMQASNATNATNSTTCLVDRCASCPDFTNLTCTACKSGYYLRSYSDGTKPYNACWSVSKLLLFMFSMLLLSLLACTLCYLCYKCG